MSTTPTHDDVSTRLSGYLDGDLDAATRATVEHHLAGCADCQRTIEDLREILDAAVCLPGAIPGRDLWTGIEMRIASAGRREAHTRGIRRRISLTLPQVAAAGIALMMLSGGLVYVSRSGKSPSPAETAGIAAPRGAIVPAVFADPQYDGAIEDLERTLEAGRDRLDPETVRVLEANLATIETAIEQSRRALEADPANTFLNSHLLSARQRKLALLRRATALTTGS